MNLVYTFQSWNMTTNGSLNIKIPESYNFFEGKLFVDWDDGSDFELIFYSLTHEYSSPGVYIPKIYAGELVPGVDCVF